MVESPTKLLRHLSLYLIPTLVVADQASKVWIRNLFDEVVGDRIPVIPGFFDLTYVQNTGAAWGMLGDHTGWLTGISIIMLIAIVLFRHKLFHDSPSQHWAFALLVGGIIGNLIDRIKYGRVTDFLDFFIQGHHWPAFNVADSCICIGVGLYIIGSSHHATAAAEPQPDKGDAN